MTPAQRAATERLAKNSTGAIQAMAQQDLDREAKYTRLLTALHEADLGCYEPCDGKRWPDGDCSCGNYEIREALKELDP